MRINERNEECPATLAEYREQLLQLATAGGIEGEQTAALEFIDELIAKDGAESMAKVPDLHMRNLLFPLLHQPRKKPLPTADDEKETNLDSERPSA